MRAWSDFPILVAMLLAIAAALVSSGIKTRQDIAGYFAEAFRPQVADLGSDPSEVILVHPLAFASVNQRPAD